MNIHYDPERKKISYLNAIIKNNAVTVYTYHEYEDRPLSDKQKEPVKTFDRPVRLTADQVAHLKGLDFEAGLTWIKDHVYEGEEGIQLSGYGWQHDLLLLKLMYKQGFGKLAQKRFTNALDNLSNLYESIHGTDSRLLDYVHNGRRFTKNLVFLTLTVPRQTKSDKYIKKECLDRMLENLIKTYNCNLYLWKAEAQVRGAIHFHVVIDTFIFQKVARRLWFKILRKHDLLAPHQLLSDSSNIVHLKEIKNIGSMRFELAGYFGAQRDEEGRIVYKHDRTKRVREIDGRSWGCSDNLRYPPMTLEACEEALLDSIQAKALKHIEVKDSGDKKRADVFVTRHSERRGKKADGSQAYQTKKSDLGDIDSLLRLYHWEQALEIYGGGRQLSRTEYEALYENPLYNVKPAAL